MHPRVEIGCAEAPQFSDPHTAYLALAGEALKCFRMDLQQGCRFARIEEPPELRERLSDLCCFVHLAHKTPYRFATRFTLYVSRNLLRAKSIERMFGAVGTATEWEGTAAMPLSFGRKLPINHSCVKVFSYTRSIAGPQFRSAFNVSCNYLQVLASPTGPCKFLKTLVIYTEKRLVSRFNSVPGHILSITILLFVMQAIWYNCYTHAVSL